MTATEALRQPHGWCLPLADGCVAFQIGAENPWPHNAEAYPVIRPPMTDAEIDASFYPPRAQLKAEDWDASTKRPKVSQANAERVLREGPDAENLFRHAVYSAGMEFAAALCDFSIVHMIKGRDYIDRDSAMALVAKWRYKVDQASKAYRDAAVLRDGEKQEPVAWAAESTTGACVRMLTKISLLESEVDRYVNRSDIAAIGCNRVKVPLYRAAPQPPAAPSGDMVREKALKGLVYASTRYMNAVLGSEIARTTQFDQKPAKAAEQIAAGELLQTAIEIAITATKD